jgi:hypothetical protein
MAEPKGLWGNGRVKSDLSRVSGSEKLGEPGEPMADLQVGVLLVRPAAIHGISFELADTLKSSVEGSARVGPIFCPLPELRG